MNDTTIQMIAQAIIANTKVIQSLIDALPHEAKVAVAGVANVAPPAPVAQAPMPVAAPAPVTVAPTPMPAPPVFTAPVAVPAPVVAPVAVSAPATLEKAPFTDGKGLIDFVMGTYKQLGPQKGAGIQGVLTGLGYSNINDINPAHYDALYAGVKGLA